MACLRKILVALVGGILLLIGLAMIVLPGPAIIVIPAALALLATEFEFARRWRERFLERIKAMRSKSANSP
jgi:tellurite resistance protein TerC